MQCSNSSFMANYSGLSKSTKDSVGFQELGTARKLYPPEPEERARAVPNSKGQLATNSEGQEQWHLFLFPSSISCHCLPWAKDKQKPKNKELVTLAPEAHKEKNREWFWEKGEHRNTDWHSESLSSQVSNGERCAKSTRKHTGRRLNPYLLQTW